MACLQNGTTLLNNNNLSSFKHNIMKYDETHANMYTSQINNFLSNQIPFRNNHTKEISQSDKIFNQDDLHSCVNITLTSDTERNESSDERNTKGTDKNETIIKPISFIKRTSDVPKINNHISDESAWLKNRNIRDASNIYNDDKEFPSVKEINNENSETVETSEPSHHARRPMNAFLIFCKRHRTIVKNRYPHLENRAVTKILGEWWAGLEPEDKACYTELAKQYKNAFFSANPNFKWYKLPAPPLRTLNTRPGNIVKSPPSPKDPPEVEEQPQQLFTPGKLADETQLGSITSLINFDNQHNNLNVVKPSVTYNDIYDSESIKEDELPVSSLSPKTNYDSYLLSPPNPNVTMLQPPKPFKKRAIQQNKDTNKIVRSIFSTNTNDTESKPEGNNIFDSSLLQQALQSFVIDETFQENFNFDFGSTTVQSPLNNNTKSNLTQQEIINKVVDHMCASKIESTDGNTYEIGDPDCNICSQIQYDQDDKSKETRKSVRSCKGLLYAKFMAESKLFTNKRNKKSMSTSTTKLLKPSYAIASDNVPRNTESIELSDTIKKLAERTIGSSEKTTTTTYNLQILDHSIDVAEAQELPETEITQETRDEKLTKMFRAADFNLDEKIEALPSLSLDKFQQKKKENKKRKFLRATRIKDRTDRKKFSKAEVVRSENDDKNANLIGSRKRKPVGKPRKQGNGANDDNKQNNNNNNNDDDKQETNSSGDLDLFALATLAEVAAKKAKIDQK